MQLYLNIFETTIDNCRLKVLQNNGKKLYLKHTQTKEKLSIQSIF